MKSSKLNYNHKFEIESLQIQVHTLHCVFTSVTWLDEYCDLYASTKL